MSHGRCECCACLSGVQTDRPANRPGLSALHYRVGSYGSFYDAMIRRLTSAIDETETGHYPLRALTTREPDDPAIALLDAWACVGDVLTFYQERIANEAFLRTATERRSVLELGRLVGYRLKPGVSATVYLAYTLDETTKTVIPAGTKAQSVPGVGEQPQMFETSEDTEARGVWNALLPRLSRPLNLTTENILTVDSIWLDGITTRLDVRDPLLFVFKTTYDKEIYALRRVLTTAPDRERNRTEVTLEPIQLFYRRVADVTRLLLRKELEKTPPKPGEALPGKVGDLHALHQAVLVGAPRTQIMRLGDAVPAIKIVQLANDVAAADAARHVETIVDGPHTLGELATPLLKPRAIPPASQWQFSRSLKQSLGDRSDYVPRLLGQFFPQLRDSLYTAIANNLSGDVPFAELASVHVLRRRAAVFGYNAPTLLFEDRPKPPAGGHELVAQPPVPEPELVLEDDHVLHLDTPDEAITVGSFLIARTPDHTVITKVVDAETVPRTAYAISGKTTRLTLRDAWATFADDAKDPIRTMVANLGTIRNTAVLAESEELTLAQRPVDRPVGQPADPGVPDSESQTRIDLDAVVDGLTPGRWIVVAGERLDTQGTRGIVSAELAMIDNVEQQPNAGAGGSAYSTLVLAPAGLAYRYKRDTVKIYGNVVKATNGETRREILGAGDASRPLQTFVLHQAPLTFVAAATVAGVASTLEVRVNDIRWREVDTLNGEGPRAHVFVTKTADDGKVSVTAGTGVTGSRLPTGSDNVRAVYRSGIGRGGNVHARQISTAIDRPLGVRDVINPIEASGGADPESRDDARRNIPVSLQALGRIVSVQDYADFARTFAGIAKASAAALSDGRRRLVHLTIGGDGDIEIDVHSDLYRMLVEALRKYGDPYQPFIVAMREKIVIAGAARVRVNPDYQWTSVGPAVRAALVDTFSYVRREFAQPVFPAEVVAAIQQVPGVEYVDLDALGGIKSADIIAAPRIPRIAGVNPIVPQPAHHGHHRLIAAQIAYLPEDLAELFVLTEITNG